MPTRSSQYLESRDLHEELGALLGFSRRRQLKYVQDFASQMEALLRVSHAIPVNSGTDGLFHALCAVGVTRGAKVLTVPNGWLSTLTILTEIGALPVFVDVDPKSGQMSAVALEKIINSDFDALIITHMYGIVGELEKLVGLARRYGVPVVEDACQCFKVLAAPENYAGTVGDVGVFSFNSQKLVGAPGSGGLVVTNNADIGETVGKAVDLSWSTALSLSQPRSPSRLAPLMIPFIRSNVERIEASALVGKERFEKIKSICAESKGWNVLSGENAQCEYSIAIVVGEGVESLRSAFRLGKLRYRIFYPGLKEFISAPDREAWKIPNARSIIQNHIGIPLDVDEKPFLRRLKILSDGVKSAIPN